MKDQILSRTFLNLHSRLQSENLNVLLGGGFGLFLKQLDFISREEIRTLLPPETWPQPRSTSDIDLFFPMEVLVNLAEMRGFRKVIDDLGYTPIEGSKFWQFVMPTTEVRIDLLTGPIEDSAKPLLKMDARRARPKGDIELHARRVPEALNLSLNNEHIAVSGVLSSGKYYTDIVKIPSPFTYLMMKITAFGDQAENADRDLGRHHALDVYRIVAMLTEDKYDETARQFKQYEKSSYAQHVKELSTTLFNSESSLGILHMKEHAFYGENMKPADFIENLRSLLSL